MIVADAGPLIALGRIDRLSILRIYKEVLCPPAAVGECLADPGKPGTAAIRAAVDAGLIEEVALAAPATPAALPIGEGELETISLARERGVEALIDDVQARRVAARLGVNVVGVWGTLLRAKAAGEIERVEPIIRDLRDAGYWASERLIADVLRLANEG